VEGDNSSEQSDPRIASFEAFDQALGATVIACDRLVLAIWDQDIVRAELAARAAVASWLHAHRALQHLEPSSFRGPRWRIAAFALAANRPAISEALDRTRRIFLDATLQQVLDHLGQVVARAPDENP
jgi:hypothetical protein